MATRAVLTPQSAEFPSSNFPELKTINSTERRMVLAFDAGTEETCAWTLVAPQGLTGTLTAVVHFTMASATTGTVQFGVSIEAVTPDSDTLDLDAATGYDTENTGTAQTVPGTAGQLGDQSVTLTNQDSIAAGDLVRVKLANKLAGTAAGDVHVHSVELRDAA